MSAVITKDEFRCLIAPILQHFNMRNQALADVVEAYAEHWRAYHGMSHIAGMLNGVEAMKIGKQLDPESLRRLQLLIVYHDVWLKIGRATPGESECMSAIWCHHDLDYYRMHWPQINHLCSQAIEATIDHSLAGVSLRNQPLVAFLLDLDLYGLGQSPERFQADTEAIWLEYQPIYTREEFDRGRKRWASRFLERDRIYHTSQFEHLEEQARANLRALATAA